MAPAYPLYLPCRASRSAISPLMPWLTSSITPLIKGKIDSAHSRKFCLSSSFMPESIAFLVDISSPPLPPPSSFPRGQRCQINTAWLIFQTVFWHNGTFHKVESNCIYDPGHRRLS